MIKQQSHSVPLDGYTLSAVTFIHDYLQLLLEMDRTDARINAYVWPRLRKDIVELSFKDTGYRDLLCLLIGKRVTTASLMEDEIVLSFEVGVDVCFSINDEDRQGPEAVVLYIGNDCFVW
jgi:hypothetical protein